MNKTGIIVLVIIILAILGFVFFGNSDTEEPIPPEESEAQSFSVTIRNLSDTQVLSPGVYAVHGPGFKMNYDGVLSPRELEPLAEYGSNISYAEYVAGQAPVTEVILIDSPILPGEEESFVFSAESGMDYHLSGIQMLVGTNDGVAVVGPVELFEEGGAGEAISVTLQASNYDNGTEENEPLLSGFAGGQPDPSRGEENIENGTPTDPQGTFVPHPQITDAVMEVSITAL